MNTTDCPYGFFRDEMGVPFPATECNANVFAWLGLAIPLVLLRGCVAWGHIHFWRKREARSRLAPNPRQGNEGQPSGNRLRQSLSRRLPIVAGLSTLTVLFQIIVVVFLSLNLLRATDGTVYPLLTLYYFPAQVAHQLYALKLVRLGRRLAFMSPAARRHRQQQKAAETQVTNTNSTVPEDSGRMAETPASLNVLSSFDNIHRMLLVVWIVAIAVHKIGELLVLLAPPAPNLVMIRLAHIAALVMNSTVTTQILYQFSRVIRAVEHNAYQQEAVRSAKMTEVIGSMRRQQFQQAIVSMPLFCMYFFFAITLSVPWWMFILFFALEAVISSSMIMSSILKLLAKKSSNSSAKHSDKSSSRNNTDTKRQRNNDHTIHTATADGGFTATDSQVVTIVAHNEADTTYAAEEGSAHPK